jgi:transcriptional regulator with XRE-family HTH domain
MGRKAQGTDRHFLKQWRERSGLSQDKLAEVIGTTGAVVSLLETGKRPLSEDWLEKIAPVLKTRKGFILDFDPSDARADFLDEVVDVHEEDREQVLDLVRSFRRKRKG